VFFGKKKAVFVGYSLGWCQQREKFDLEEPCKFDCWLVRMIFIFCCPLSIFTSHWLGWCWEREKIDWQEPCKFDCWLVQMIFIFLLSLINFHKTLASGKIVELMRRKTKNKNC